MVKRYRLKIKEYLGLFAIVISIFLLALGSTDWNFNTETLIIVIITPFAVFFGTIFYIRLRGIDLSDNEEK